LKVVNSENARPEQIYNEMQKIAYGMHLDLFKE